MANNFRTYTITIGKVFNGTKECTNPSVEIAGSSDIAINCIDSGAGIYTVQIGPNDTDPCIKFIVTCEECDVCPPQIIEKCFCDDIDDCDACQTCTNGFCQSLCPEDECVNGQCVECISNTDCLCNQVCVNGSCKCPVGSVLNSNGCCDYCTSNDDCSNCEVCVNANGYGSCVPIQCPNGVCDPTNGECVECVNTGDCPTNECCQQDLTCECCPGFVRVNGVCVPAPCVFDEDCGACQVCESNNCVPQTCPGNQIPVVQGNECLCSDICNCDAPDCSNETYYCADSIVDGICGCVPCEGDCASGCVDPCICDEVENKCVNNPCQNQTCTTGLDCGEGCGCLNGQCVSCENTRCDNSDCARTLGCYCNNSNNCVDDERCNATPCSVAGDCPFGCTCYQGECVSCSNFSCSTSACAERDGCVCISGTCSGDATTAECTDTVVIEKDDLNCELTGKLTKEACCSCPALTLDIKNQTATINATTAALKFIGEVRKGAYDGVSVDSKPRVDNFSHPSIAVNEPPTTGTYQMAYEVTYDVFNIEVVNGEEVRIYAGTTTDAPVTSNATFPSSGTTAQVDFNTINVPLIGTEQNLGSQVRVVKSVKLTFTLINDLEFPNLCTYSGATIGSYVVTANSEFTKLKPVATTVNSPDCRKPLFKWTKSSDASFDEAPFRKVYASTTNNSTWTDTFGDEEGLESCFYYLFEPDCTCEDPVSDYIVLCNPADINFTLAQCNTEFTLRSPFVPCDVNEDVRFRIQAGSIDINFLGSNPPINTKYTSDVEIEKIIYSIDCDSEGACTKEYSVSPTPLEVQVTTECVGNGSTFRAIFTQPTNCPINTIRILETGDVLSGILEIDLPVGTYTAQVEWGCGCDSKDVVFFEDCCDNFTLSPCSRECDGTIVGCNNDPGVT